MAHSIADSEAIILARASTETVRSDTRSGASDGHADTYGMTNGGSTPTLLHKIQNERSILALAISASKIFAGTQGGEILVWSLHTFQLLLTMQAHGGAVLGLFISQDGQLLFSSAGDAIVNVWSTDDLSRIYSVYSTYDVGDVFCVVYSSRRETIYLGAQNTSIQWYDLSSSKLRPPPDFSSHPSQRSHRFFDSKGPGGTSAPRPSDRACHLKQGGQTLEIPKENILQYAHFGYVYCMLLAESVSREDIREEILISGGGDGTVKLWNLDDHGSNSIKEKAILENGHSSILAMALNGTFLYTGRLGGDVNVWDLDTHQLIQTIKAYDVDVLTVAVGHGIIFTGGADGSAKIFERYRPKKEWQAHDRLILASSVASFNGRPFLATGGNDNCVAIWNMSESIQVYPRTIRESNEQLIESLTRLVAFRTVSSRAEYAEDCRRGASFLRNLFKRFGATTELLNTKETWNPVVYARFRGKTSAGKKILFYGHYDVVAAENEQQKWVVPPFSTEGRNGYLYGRGVSDNKGPLLAALYAVADLVAEQKLETDIIFLVEGEEECGSRGFRETIRRNKELIGEIDWILMANSYWLNDDHPCLTYGLRGVIHAKIMVDSGQNDLHSGVDGSQQMNESLKDLVSLLAKLTGVDGRIVLPGFYDNIPSMTRKERRYYDAINRRLQQGKDGPEDSGISTASLIAKWREPSLTIHGFETSGPANNTIIPHLATAAISIRLVPNQDAEDTQKILTEYLHAEFAKLNTPNKLIITTERPVDPWVGDPDNKIYQILEKAVVDVWELDARAKASPNDTGRLPDDLATHSMKSVSSESRPADAIVRRACDRSEGSDEIPERSRHFRHNSIDQQSMKPLYIREGGSIPAIRFLEKEFDAPAAQLPCGQASDNAHLDNERLRLVNLYNSRKIFRKVFKELPIG